MKQLLVVIAVIVLTLAFASIAYADAPNWEMAMTKCSGLTLAQLESARMRFDTLYGYKHQLTTAEQWQSTYRARTNEFARLFGCPEPIGDDGLLTFSYRIYAPIYDWAINNAPLPY